MGRLDSSGASAGVSEASRDRSVRAGPIHCKLRVEPVIDRQSPTRHCAERNRKIVDLIGKAAPDVVLLHAGWGLNDTADELRPTIDALRARGIARIVIVGPVPVWRGGLPNAVANHYWRTQSVLPERTPLYFDRGSGDENLRKVAATLGVDYISARNAFCNGDGCISRVGTSLVASDAVHLTETGSILLARSILGQLRMRQSALSETPGKSESLSPIMSRLLTQRGSREGQT